MYLMVWIFFSRGTLNAFYIFPETNMRLRFIKYKWVNDVNDMLLQTQKKAHQKDGLNLTVKQKTILSEWCLQKYSY